MGNKNYVFYDWFGNICEESLRENELLDRRCPRDGVRLVSYDGDPHRVVACPLCSWKPSHYRQYNKELDILGMEEKIKALLEEVKVLKCQLEVISHEDNGVRLLNLKT